MTVEAEQMFTEVLSATSMILSQASQEEIRSEVEGISARGLQGVCDSC